jgi:hypothetical protein
MRPTKSPSVELLSEGTSSILIDSIFIMFGRRGFYHTAGIPMCTKGALLLAYLFRYSYEVDFIQGLLMKNENS